MKALKKFTGIVNGKEKTFQPGDRISKAEAKELGLNGKPDLAKPEKAEPKAK